MNFNKYMLQFHNTGKLSEILWLLLISCIFHTLWGSYDMCESYRPAMYRPAMFDEITEVAYWSILQLWDTCNIVIPEQSGTKPNLVAKI